MKSDKALTFNEALNSKGLLIKHLNGEQYSKLIEVKRPLVRFIDQIMEDRNELFKAYDLKPGDKFPQDPSFTEKMKVIDERTFEPKHSGFIAMPEFKKFTNEVDLWVGAVLSEYLLKNEQEETV